MRQGDSCVCGSSETRCLTMQNPFRKLTVREMLMKQLDDSQRARVESSAIAEEHASHVQMLNVRIARIQQEIQAMNTNEIKEPTQ